MKNSIYSKLAASFVGVATLVSTGGSALADNDWHHRPPSAPEAGTWLIGAGILALLGLDFVRRKFARRTKSSAS